MYIYAKFYVLGNFMKERQSRLKAIKNLIKNNRIESQDDLLSLLLKEGFDVTQATLSRDLKLLTPESFCFGSILQPAGCKIKREFCTDSK